MSEESDESSFDNCVVLLEDYRLVEKDESQVSLKWKATPDVSLHQFPHPKQEPDRFNASVSFIGGSIVELNHEYIIMSQRAHLLLFVLSFIFGSLCTFCLNLLAYMFDEHCVLFPQLMALDATKYKFILEFLPKDAQKDMLPVDFLSIQWADDTECEMPAFVPLCSAIFGLIWTTLFIMCSSGTSTYSLQRLWRLMLPVLIFSLTMGGLCAYASMTTYNGLQQLCLTIGKFTGSEDCSYIMNVATLPYEGRIRGVYQAVRLTILTAWLHTLCWLLAAALVLVRVFLVVDFQLVKIKAELRGDVESFLQHNEELLRSVQIESGITFDPVRHRWVVVPKSTPTQTEKYIISDDEQTTNDTDVIYLSKMTPKKSQFALTFDESKKRVTFQETKNILYDLLDRIPLKQSSVEMYQQSLETPSYLKFEDPGEDSDDKHVSFNIKWKDDANVEQDRTSSSSNDSQSARKRKLKLQEKQIQTDKTETPIDTTASLHSDEGVSTASSKSIKDTKISIDKKKDE